MNAGWLSAKVDSVDNTMVSLVDAAADDFGVYVVYADRDVVSALALLLLLLMVQDVAVDDSDQVDAGKLSAKVDRVDRTMVSLRVGVADDTGAASEYVDGVIFAAALLAKDVLAAELSEYTDELLALLLVLTGAEEPGESSAGVRTIEVLAVLSVNEVVAVVSCETAAAELTEDGPDTLVLLLAEDASDDEYEYENSAEVEVTTSVLVT